MRTALIGFAAILTILVAGPVLAKTTSSGDTMKACAASWKAMPPADKAKTSYKAYSSTCLSGKGATAMPVAPVTAAAAPTAAAPAAAMKASLPKTVVAGPAPAGATAKCKDGSFSMSKTHSGSCSGHGGVATWL